MKFATFDTLRAGWCVWQQEGTAAHFERGPFATREEAEALLGPKLHGFAVVLDPAVPAGTVEFRRNGQLVGRIVNVIE